MYCSASLPLFKSYPRNTVLFQNHEFLSLFSRSASRKALEKMAFFISFSFLLRSIQHQCCPTNGRGQNIFAPRFARGLRHCFHTIVRTPVPAVSVLIWYLDVRNARLPLPKQGIIVCRHLPPYGWVHCYCRLL